MTGDAIATLSPDRGSILFAAGDWSTRFPVADLPKWVRLYRDLIARGSKTKGKAGPWASFHEPKLAALLAVAKELNDAK